MLPILLLVAAASAVPPRSEDAAAGPPVTFHFSDLKVLTDMFQDCDTYISSDGGSPHNLYDVSQPFQVYTEWRTFEKLGMSKDGMPSLGSKHHLYYYDKKLGIFRDELTQRNCKAQILVFYHPAKLTETWTPAFRYDETTFCYTVVIHKDDYYIRRWSWRTILVGATRAIIPHLYHVTITCDNDEGLDHSPSSSAVVISPIAAHYQGWTTCNMNYFLLTCLFCLDSEWDVLSWGEDYPRTWPLQIARLSRRYGSIDVNEYFLSLAYEREHVRIDGLVLEAAMIDFVLPETAANFQQSIASVQEKFGQHAVLTKLDEFILPESLFLHSVLTHHVNVSVNVGGTFMSAPTPREIISGPGLTFGKFLATHVIPVGTAGLSFMTCSNISLVGQSRIFSAPLDGNTWIWTLTSMVAVSLALLMATKKMSVGAALFLLMYTMVRLLLDNHSDVSKALVRRGKLMATLTFLMALATIILSNGYKGVLTSDLSMAPVPVGGLTFEQVLDSGWTVSPCSHTTVTKNQKASGFLKLDLKSRIFMILVEWLKSANLWADVEDFAYTGPGLKEYQLMSSIENVLTDRTEWKKCHCNGSYWLFETGTFWPSLIPQECNTISKSRPFFVSQERIANRILSWSSKAMRPGPVFRSIGRGVEAGLYYWLNKIRRTINTAGITVKGNMMTRVMKKEPKPLSMKTPLVSSTFRLHVVLSLITVAALVGEFLWKHRKRIYFKVMWWINVLNHGDIMEIVQELYAAYYEDDA